ncbi:MAG: hypothetical protein QOG52_1134, partial [Frankiaceae bacterium]|nr:hypothetical protein [Frankiaceae bacterium]
MSRYDGQRAAVGGQRQVDGYRIGIRRAPLCVPGKGDGGA